MSATRSQSTREKPRNSQHVAVLGHALRGLAGCYRRCDVRAHRRARRESISEKGATAPGETTPNAVQECGRCLGRKMGRPGL